MAEGKRKEDAAVQELTVPVAGMTCAACVTTIEKALRGLPGVREASVSLAGGKAAVRLDPTACTLPDIERAIEDVGYEVPWARLELLVLGMMGAHCEENITAALKALPGVVSVRATSATDSVVVEYSEALVSAAVIKKTVRALGYEVTEKGQGEDSLDRERRLRQAEVRRQLLNMLFAWPLGALVMLGTFRDSWSVLEAILPSFMGEKLFLFAL
ncbi:MAG: heavy metal-associated domain-containing protein, partial [Dehalococcoidia bacterium]|nr:heavy metal-associated domain-containing protein [Dehalococcoidia bacterium]